MREGLAASLTGFQRWVIGVAAVLIVIRLFAPVRYGIGEYCNGIISYIPGIWFGDGSGICQIRIGTGATLMHALALALLAAAVCVLYPAPGWALSDRAKRIAINVLWIVGPTALVVFVFWAFWGFLFQ